MPRWKASLELGISEDSLKRWEDPTEKAMPTSSDVNRMERLYKSPGLWYAWMYSNDDGFRDNMSPPMAIDLRGTVLSLLADITGMMTRQEEIMRDAADGKIDNAAEQRELFCKSRDIARAALSLCTAIKDQMRGNPA